VFASLRDNHNSKLPFPFEGNALESYRWTSKRTTAIILIVTKSYLKKLHSRQGMILLAVKAQVCATFDLQACHVWKAFIFFANFESQATSISLNFGPFA
jgi:hypothetical protein